MSSHKNNSWCLAMLAASLLGTATALEQQPCASGIRIEGLVVDPTGAVIVAATVATPTGAHTSTDEAGRFVLACVPANSEALTVAAEGFSPTTVRPMRGLELRLTSMSD